MTTKLFLSFDKNYNFLSVLQRGKKYAKIYLDCGYNLTFEI